MRRFYFLIEEIKHEWNRENCFCDENKNKIKIRAKQNIDRALDMRGTEKCQAEETGLYVRTEF